MGDTLELGRELAKVGVSLALVLGLLALAVYGMKRFGNLIRKSDGIGEIEVLSQRAVGLKHYLLIVRAQDQILLLGLSPQGINLLTTLGQSTPSRDEKTGGDDA